MSKIPITVAQRELLRAFRDRDIEKANKLRAGESLLSLKKKGYIEPSTEPDNFQGWKLTKFGQETINRMRKK